VNYGRTPLQETLLVGRRLLSRHYYGDGRWGWRSRTGREQQEWADWRVVKHRPKTVTWATARGPLARKVHAVRYTLAATHLPSGNTVHLTMWQCGGMSHTAPLRQSHPDLVCAGCAARLSGVTEVALPEEH
jgi:hypothetical protein